MSFKGQIFFVSDTHFGSRYWNKYRNFLDTEEMDNHICDVWNSVVGPNDKVYHLGDVANSKKSLELIKRLNGKKCLIKGNHDNFNINKYLDVFYDIRSMHLLKICNKDVIFTHIPIAIEQLNRFSVNVHGHVHICDETCPTNLKYFNICSDFRADQHKSIIVPFEEIEKYILSIEEIEKQNV